MQRGWLGLVMTALLLPAARADEAVPLAVRQGRCTFVLPGGRPADKYFLVVGSLARERGPFTVRLSAQATTDSPALPHDVPSTDPAWSLRINEWRLHLERTRRFAPPLPVAAQPPASERVFRLALPEATVPARLVAMGRYCQVYVDREHGELLSATAADIVRGLDEQVIPQARQLLGQVADIDGDGRFTVLLTPRLPSGLGGYVDRQDFAAGGCDQMVLSASLQPGPHLQALLAHEYTHAIVYGGAGGPRAEEDWLNEGLAHVAEEALGHGWTNLDYRVAAYGNAPEDYPLVVPDHQQAGLWRHPGHRGAAFLFLRHACQRHGQGLLRQLTQTSLTGVANLEVATGEPFADLFRSWSVSMLRSEPRGQQYVALKPTEPSGRLAGLFEEPSDVPVCLPASPRFHELPLTEGQISVKLAGTAVSYILLHSPGSRAVRVSVAGDPLASLQVTLVNVPAHAPRLSVRTIMADGGVRLEVTAHDAEVTLQTVAWSLLVPTGRSDLHQVSARNGFAKIRLGPGERVRSEVFPESSQSVVWRIVGSGADGQPVTGWHVHQQERAATAAGW